MNTHGRSSTANHSPDKAAHLRLLMGVRNETKEHLRPLLTRPPSLEMSHYCIDIRRLKKN